MIEFFLSIIETLFQGFIALVLGIFGFTWNDPEPPKEDEAVTTAIVRIQEMVRPAFSLDLHKITARNTKSDCANGKIKTHTVDMPMVISVSSEQISS